MDNRAFFVEVEYETGMFEGFDNLTLPLQGDDNYQISSPGKGGKLGKLMNSARVIVIRGVPEEELPFRTFDMQKTKGSLLPHQDTTYTDREDPRRWNLFTNKGSVRENKGGFVAEMELVHRYSENLARDFIRPQKFTVENIKKRIESEIEYPTIYLQEFRSGSLRYMNPGAYWTIATKLFRNYPNEVDDFAKRLLDSMSGEEGFRWLRWDEPNTVVLFDNPHVYHGRLGGNPTESVITRRWLTEPGYIRTNEY